MKKLFFSFVMCLMALTVQAQRCAVLEFKAGVGVSQNDVDGISSIFTTYFRPAGYTMVERTRIDKVIEEQGFQRSKMTEGQMVRVGEILNVSKVVVGDINIVMNQYNVDVRVINVESGVISATEGATFTGASYRTHMQSVAQKLAGKIAITSGGTVQASPKPTTSDPRKRTTVEVLYGYLKIFPNELGTFDTEPTSVINQINRQAMHGYNNWRIPTNEELSLMKANNYLSNGEYMTRENKRGIVLLVTDGKDAATLQQEEEKVRKEEEGRKAAEEQRKESLKAQGWVDLGLTSGTLWKDRNEPMQYTYIEAVDKFGKNLPTKKQFQELIDQCQFLRINGGDYKVTGPNGNSIVLQAEGQVSSKLEVRGKGEDGWYWSSTPQSTKEGPLDPYHLKWYNCYNDSPYLSSSRGNYIYYSRSVRLVLTP